jgi:hypothetical protein
VVAAEFRDVAGQQQPDVVAEVEEVPSRGRRHSGQLAVSGVAPAVHQAIIVMQPARVHAAVDAPYLTGEVRGRVSGQEVHDPAISRDARATNAFGQPEQT